MPQQTVADEVLGPPAMPPQGMPQQAGMTALPSGLPPQMAGGGIVAFADGGDIDDYADGGVVRFDKGGSAGIIDVVDPNWASSKLFKRRYTDDDKFAILAEQLAQLTAQERQAQGPDKVRIQADMNELRNTMRGLKAGPSARSLMNIIPMQSAAAGELDRMSMSSSGRAGYVEDPLLRGVNIPDRSKSPVREISPVAPPSAPSPKPEAKKEEPKKFDVQPAEKEPSAEKAATEPELKRPEDFAAEQLEVPAKPDFSEQYGKVRDAYKEAGVNVDLYKDLRNQLKEKKATFGERRNAALGHAMMAFGFEMLGARRGQEFARMSQAGQKALYQYMGSMDKIAENEDKLEALDRQVQLAEQQFKMSGADSAMRRVEKLEDQRTAILGKNAELAQDANKVRAQVGADLYRTDKTYQANIQAAAARLAAALGANRGGLTDKQIIDLRAQMEMQYGPALREQYKDLGSKNQIEKKVQEELDKKFMEEVGKARNIRQSGNIAVPSSGQSWQVEPYAD